jgi:hypothetical protein
VPREEEKLKLGKRAAFDKSRFKRLRQEDETWEADFQALPKPITQSQTHTGAWSWPRTAPCWPIPRSRAGRRSMTWPRSWPMPCGDRWPGKRTGPRRIHVRGHPQWKELIPHLDKLDIKVAVHRELPKVQEAYRGYLRKQREAHRRGMVKPTADQQTVEKLFPAIAQWVQGKGMSRLATRKCSASSCGCCTTGSWPSRTTSPTRWRGDGVFREGVEEVV